MQTKIQAQVQKKTHASTGISRCNAMQMQTQVHVKKQKQNTYKEANRKCKQKEKRIVHSALPFALASRVNIAYSNASLSTCDRRLQ